MPPKANIKPTKTLTQRRGNGSSSESASETQTTRLSSLSSPNNFSGSPLEHIAKNDNEGSGGSVVKIIIWAIIILSVGVGLALIVRNMTQDNDTNKADDKTAEETEDTDTDTDTNTDDTTDTTGDGTDTDTTTDTGTDTTTDTGTDTTTDDDTTTDTTTGSILTNEYSKNNQTIADGLTGSSITLAGYTYANYSANLEYRIKLGTVTKFPGVTAAIDTEAKTLTVTVSNVKADKIVGTNKTGSTTFAGSPNASKVDITNASGKTTFVFTLGTVTDYKITAMDGEEYDSINVFIKNK